MIKIVTWTRVPGLLTLGAAAVLAGCEAPTAVVNEDAARVDLPMYMAKKTGATPATPPTCGALWNGGPDQLCFAAVNTKHGNSSGLPLNLNGIENGDQYDGNGNGAALTVTVLGTLQFDLSAIDMSTVVAGDVETVPSKTPVDTKGNGQYQASIVDVNGDGILDLVLHFNIPLMYENGDISRTTTEICVYGEGPGYVINGCGQDGNGGGGPPPPPPYPGSDLPACDFRYNAARGYECRVVQVFGKGTAIPMAAVYVGGNEDSHVVQPNWTTIPVDQLLHWPVLVDGEVVIMGRPNIETDENDNWALRALALGNDRQAALWGAPDFLANCGVVPQSGYYIDDYSWAWHNGGKVLTRTDLNIPAGAQNVSVEFLVDDLARVYFNGVEVTRDWTTSGADGQCVTYGKTITVRVPDELLSADGVNMVAVEAWDEGNSVNYLDYRVFAEIKLPQ